MKTSTPKEKEWEGNKEKECVWDDECDHMVTQKEAGREAGRLEGRLTFDFSLGDPASPGFQKLS